MMKMTLENKLLVNPYFYEPRLEKIAGNKAEISSVLGIPEGKIVALQYWDKETTSFIRGARVFRVIQHNKEKKVRSCKDEKEAKELYERASYAFSLGIPMSAPLDVAKNLVIFSYIKGRPLRVSESERYLTEISAIQARLNNIKFSRDCNKAIKVLLEKMIEESFSKLIEAKVDHNIIGIIKENLATPPEIFATFDHQDFGLHNIILGEDKKIYVVDEEAFGILPLGYGVIRPIFERKNYRVTTAENIDKYMVAFSDEQTRYTKTNLNYFRAVFILRNSLRRWLVGNIHGAMKLLEEVKIRV